MDEILERARRVAEEAEVFISTLEETPVEFEADRLKHLQSRQSKTVALRIIKNGRLGYATTTRTDDIGRLVDDAVATAEFGTTARFTFPATSDYPAVNVYDPAIEDVTLEQMVALGQGMIDALKRHTPELLCDASVSRAVCHVSIANSRGGYSSFRQSIFSLFLEGQLVRGTDMLFVGDHASSCRPQLDGSDIIASVRRQLELARQNAEVPTRSMPVVFTPRGVASTFARPLLAAFNGKAVLEGASPVGNRLGEVVFDRRLSVVDDATLDFRPGSAPCDDEAVPGQRTALVTAGKVTGFLYDLQTAGQAGTSSTGNGHRTQGGQPQPGPSSVIISPGDTSFEEMVAGIDEGLVVDQLMGAGQGNTLGGDFSGNVLLGFKVEQGRLVGRVKNTMVSGNIYQALGEIAAIGNDTRWVAGIVQTPSILCPAIAVASQ